MVTLVQPLGDKMDVYLASDGHFEPGEVGARIATNKTRGLDGWPV